MLKICTALIVSCLLISSARAEDWPAYRADASRSGYTSEAIPTDLALQWTYSATHAPQPAWPRSDRMKFDRAMQVVVADGRVFFGSTVTGKLTALDAESGAEIWSYITDAPIRFAPTVWRDRLFVASDDGHLYALSAVDGKLLWKRRGGSSDRMIIGNHRLISKWPARGGPVVVDDVVYFAAGIWPSDGTFLYAIHCETGEPVWINDDSGSLLIQQPHGTRNASMIGVASQGYLVAADDRLLMPTGRSLPAGFDRATGEFVFFHQTGRIGDRNSHKGGGTTLVAENHFFSVRSSYFMEDGTKTPFDIGDGPLARLSEGMVRAAEGKLFVYQWADLEEPNRQGELIRFHGLEEMSVIENIPSAMSVIVSGSRVIVGGDGTITLIDLPSQEKVWSTECPGKILGLAVSDGKLLASNDLGDIFCFAVGEPAALQAEASAPVAPLEANATLDEVVEEIFEATGMTTGYCLDLGCGDGALTEALLRHTELHVVAIDENEEAVARLRKRLDEHGLLGSRATVLCRSLDDTGLPNYFANLIVSGRALGGSTIEECQAEIDRVQQPYGGTVCLGRPGKIETSIRGPLEGAGQWTHQYGDAGNTVCSDDELVTGQLGMLWFGDLDLDLSNRHGRGPAPLFYQGRLYYQGLHEVIAVDAYNGREIWRFEITGLLAAYNAHQLMGTAGAGANWCAGDDSIFIRHEGHCLRLDAATGQLLRQYNVPGATEENPGRWGYIAYDEGRLYGSVADPEHTVTARYQRNRTGNDMSILLTESKSLFALDPETGEITWQLTAEHSIRHNAIAIGSGRVYLIDRPQALFDRISGEKGEQPLGQLMCLDAASGEVLWKGSEDACFGTMLAYSERHDVLLVSYQATAYRLVSEKGGQLAGVRGQSGEQMWQVEAEYRTRPMINDSTVYAHGGAWDLNTGEDRPFEFPRRHGCGVLTCSRDMVLCRSLAFGYFDLNKQDGMQIFAGVRPGCWLNSIPAGGLVLVPDASSGCSCSYLNKSWFALEPLPPEPVEPEDESESLPQ